MKIISAHQIPAKNKNKQGFTLIELILSVVIIIILTGSVIRVIDPRALRAKARDSQRESDVRMIQAALENYFADNRNYPTDSGSCSDFYNLSVDGNHPLAEYMNEIPDDPDGDSYRYTSDTSTYSLEAAMEIETSSNSNNCTCFGITYCYRVTSP